MVAQCSYSWICSVTTQDLLATYPVYLCYQLPDGLTSRIPVLILLSSRRVMRSKLTMLSARLLIFCCLTKNATSLPKGGGGSADSPERCQKVANSSKRTAYHRLCSWVVFFIILNNLGFFTDVLHWLKNNWCFALQLQY